MRNFLISTITTTAERQSFLLSIKSTSYYNLYLEPKYYLVFNGAAIRELSSDLRLVIKLSVYKAKLT